MARALADDDTDGADDLRANSEAFFYKLDDMEFNIRKATKALLQDNEKYILCLETPETSLMSALLANTLRKLIKEDFSNQYSELVFTNLHSFIKVNKQQNENFPDILVCKVDIDEHLDQHSEVLTSWSRLVKDQSKKIIFVTKNLKYLEQNMLKTRNVNVLKIKFTELWEEHETLNNYYDEKQQNNKVNLNKQINNEVKGINVNKEKEDCSDNISLHGATEIIKPLEILKLHAIDILSINDVDEKGNTPLHLAASKGQNKIVKALLHFDVAKGLRNTDGCTPLHLATLEGHYAVVNTLLENDANVNATESVHSQTALHKACMSNDVRMIKLLLRFGAEIESKTKTGNTALFFASFHGHNAAVTTLLEHGSNINTQNNDGHSALHQARRTNNHNVVLNLIQNGADLNLRDKYQKTALEYEESNERYNLVPISD